ncbi:MAG: GspH/FimT family pseudopilin [candidate division NC10 bacterium]|nr:GspH/FimT family pseudopilin [candidate division NC10 bacterium]
MPGLRGEFRRGQNSRWWRCGRRGVTALELVTIVVLCVIIAAIAIPGMSPVVLNHRLRGAAWQVAGDLRLARQRAVTVRRPFRVCVNNCAIAVPAGAYSVERNNGTPGNPGWVNETGVVTQLPSDVTVSLNQTVSFNVTGQTSGGTFTLVNLIGTYQVVVNSTGRVVVCKGSCP